LKSGNAYLRDHVPSFSILLSRSKAPLARAGRGALHR
jgi:hypothetical protein